MPQLWSTYSHKFLHRSVNIKYIYHVQSANTAVLYIFHGWNMHRTAVAMIKDRVLRNRDVDLYSCQLKWARWVQMQSYIPQ